MTSAGVAPEQARRVERQVGLELSQAVDRIRNELREQSFTKVDRASLETQIAKLGKELADTVRSQTNWLTGVVLTATGLVIAALKLL
jgi:hypothetical protein